MNDGGHLKGLTPSLNGRSIPGRKAQGNYARFTQTKFPKGLLVNNIVYIKSRAKEKNNRFIVI